MCDFHTIFLIRASGILPSLSPLSLPQSPGNSIYRTPACSTTEQAGSFFVCYVCNNRAFVHYVRIVFGHGFAVSSLYYRLSSGHRSTPAVDGFHFAIILYVTVRCLNVSTQKVKSYTFLLSNSVETHQNAHSNVQKCRKMAYTIVYVNFFLYLCSRFYARVR